MALNKIFAGALAATLLAGTAYWWWMDSLTGAEPALQAAARSPISPPPLPSPAASTMQAVQAPPTVAPPMGPSAPLQIGSEGYGPLIERAYEAGTAERAWQAVAWLRSCALNDQTTQSLQIARDHGTDHAAMTRAIQALQAEARRCQTVTAQHLALMPELTLRAMRGSIPGAAAAYAATGTPAELDTALQTEVTTAIRRDAQAGETSTLINAAMSEDRWGLSDQERLTYLMAYGLSGQPGAKEQLQALTKQDLIKIRQPSAEQLAAARLAAQRIVNVARSRQVPG